jgi:hypothetical protein
VRGKRHISAELAPATKSNTTFAPGAAYDAPTRSGLTILINGKTSKAVIFIWLSLQIKRAIAILGLIPFLNQK